MTADTNKPSEALITTSQAARMLATDVQEINRLVGMGLLRYSTTTGGKRHFRSDDVEELRDRLR